MPRALALVLTAVVALASAAGFARAAAPPEDNPCAIVSPVGASFSETLAAKDVRRYVYLRTGRLLPIIEGAAETPKTGDLIIVAAEDRPLGRPFLDDLSPQMQREPVQAEHYLLKTVRRDNRTVVLIVGGDPIGTLYGAYRFAEHLGVRFYLHGDVVPDERIPFALPALDEAARPLFAVRGIQPFHDFPEGPDWWDLGHYKAVISQLPKLRMNFIGLHTYPEGGPNAEPTVWIGLPQDVKENGDVAFSYPASYQNTLRGNWGYKATRTGDYHLGASQLFERDAFGSDVMTDLCPQPQTPQDCNTVFNRMAAVLREAFEHAHRLGVKTCVGTETPLRIPKAVQERLKARGKKPNDPAIVQELYEGIFRRIARAYPLDYCWFWTPEGWTGRKVKPEQVKATQADLAVAIAAARKVKAPFTLATCGWVLGPQGDRALFDKTLPKDMPMSCINRQVGKSPVEPGFAQVTGRPKWAIPWLEDDPNLLAPQLWVGRMRKDAVDALKYGCTGLLGIHWRTRILGPNVAALARAAWNQQGWTSLAGPADRGRHAPSGDFYLDWARSQFGPEVAEEAARVFERIDGRLPQPSTWVKGPGGLKPSAAKREDVAKRYAFVLDFAHLEPRIRGAGNLARFHYWLNNFRYMIAIENVRSAWHRKDTPAMKAAAADVYRHLLAAVSNPGELGTVANWEQHVLPMLKIDPDKAYKGPTRVIVPTVRTSVTAGETLDLKVIILSEGKPRSAALYHRPLGAGGFVRAPLRHVARGVFRVQVSPKAGTDFEYYVEAVPEKGEAVRFPATAPTMCQTVVVMPQARSG